MTDQQDTADTDPEDRPLTVDERLTLAATYAALTHPNRTQNYER